MSGDIESGRMYLRIATDPATLDDGTINVHKRGMMIDTRPIVNIRFHELDRVIEILQRAKVEIEKQREPIA